MESDSSPNQPRAKDSAPVGVALRSHRVADIDIDEHDAVSYFSDHHERLVSEEDGHWAGCHRLRTSIVQRETYRKDNREITCYWTPGQLIKAEFYREGVLEGETEDPEKVKVWLNENPPA